MTWRINKLYIHKQKKKESFKKIAVIIPTLGEEPQLIEKVVDSICKQDYPQELLNIVISDDARDERKRNLLMRLSQEYRSKFFYLQPYSKESTLRRGQAKAGNLNFALDFITQNLDVDIIETRDADDIVGDNQFYKKTIPLLAKNKVAFVQTLKTSIDSGFDLYGNKEEYFYKFIMSTKNNTNCVFPCGSGLIWNKNALVKIGGFPTWNLVEDVQSGIEIQRIGLKGIYVDVNGANSIAPVSDLPNMYKQRGTWAIDSFRTLFFLDLKGLSFLQKISAYEPALYYLLSIINFFYSFIPPLVLITDFSNFEFTTPQFAYIYLLQTLIFLLYPLVNAIFYGVSLRSLYRSIENFYGLSGVYMKSLVKALIYGVDNKPAYKVTRKSKNKGIFFNYVFLQIIVLGFLGYSIFVELRDFYVLSQPVDLISLIWASFYAVLYTGFITKAFSI